MSDQGSLRTKQCAHTPGPWTLTYVEGSNFAVQKFDIRGVFDTTPNVYPIFNRSLNAIDGTHVYCSPQDARLIAAAPELLYALSDMVNTFSPVSGPSEETIIRALEVIKKATT